MESQKKPYTSVPFYDVSPVQLSNPKEITREAWVREVFPEWGRYLNYEVAHYQVPKGQVSIWWEGGSSWILKTDAGTVFLIDQFASGSESTYYGECGVCYQAGAPFINWMRLIPQYIDPWAFERIDGFFMSHIHLDHCDPYAVAGAAQTTDTKFYGPKVVAEKTENVYGVPKDRVVKLRVGDVLEFPGAKVHVLPCYDDTAIRTGTAGALLDYDDCALCYLFETSGGNILFAGDTWYNDRYVEIGKKYDIDVATFDMGFNAVGATDKMTPYDALRFGQAIGAKVLIPDHYDLYANIAGDPHLLIDQFERLVAETAPQMKTVIMQGGGRFDYPKDQNIRRYWYPDGSENYNFEKSALYQQIAAHRPVLENHKKTAE